MKTKQQVFTPDLQWIYGQGWTLRGAAEFLSVNPGHLSRVIRGERISKRLMTRVSQLPRQRLVLRNNKEREQSR